GNRHERIKVLFPEPLTPVTTTNRPKGNRTVRFLRLFSEAFCNVSQSFVAALVRTRPIRPALDLRRLPSTAAEIGRRAPRVGNFFSARKLWPVMDSGCFASSSNVPLATTSPP